MNKKDWNSYTALITESPEAPVKRVHVNAKDRESVRALVYQHHPRGRVLSVSEVTEVTDVQTEGSTGAHGEGRESGENSSPE